MKIAGGEGSWQLPTANYPRKLGGFSRTRSEAITLIANSDFGLVAKCPSFQIGKRGVIWLGW